MPKTEIDHIKVANAMSNLSNHFTKKGNFDLAAQSSDLAYELIGEHARNINLENAEKDQKKSNKKKKLKTKGLLLIPDAQF